MHLLLLCVGNYQCDKLLGLALENHEIAWKTTGEIINVYMHVNDVGVMLSPDFLFPRFLVFPPANPSNLSH